MHLPIHRKLTKFINLRSSFLSLINDNLLVFQFYLFTPMYTFCPFIQFKRFSRQVYWGSLPFPPPVDHILSELSAMTHPSWVALHTWLIASWHHQCNGHERGQTSGDGEEQGGLAYCSPWGRKKSDMTGQLNNNLYIPYLFGTVPQNYLRGYVPGFSSQYSPNKT